MSANESSYNLDEDINGPVFAVAVGLELVLGLVLNLFIVLYTLCHCKVLQQPSMILLMWLALVSLLVTTLFLPFTVISAAAGGWIFGQTAGQKYGTCQFVGFVFSLGVTLTFHMLALLSIDRFLFIVKPLVHRSYVKPWVAWVLVSIVWFLAVLQNIAPFVGLGENDYAPFVASCLPSWYFTYYVLYYTVLTLVPITIITVTTLWTFCFTRMFLRRADKDLKLTSTTVSMQQVEYNVYSKKIRHLFGIFGMLLAVLVASVIPFVLAGIASAGLDIPAPVYATVFIVYFASTIAYPTIQAYFRQDLRDAVVNGFRRLSRKSEASKV